VDGKHFENGAFRKRSSNRGNLNTPAFGARVDRKHFENGAFRKRCGHDNHVISLPEFSSNTNPKWPVIGAFLSSSGVVCTKNI